MLLTLPHTIRHRLPHTLTHTLPHTLSRILPRPLQREMSSSSAAPPAKRQRGASSAAALPGDAAELRCAASPSLAHAAPGSLSLEHLVIRSDEACADGSASSKKAPPTTERAPAAAKGGKRRAATSATNVRAHPLVPLPRTIRPFCHSKLNAICCNRMPSALKAKRLLRRFKLNGRRCSSSSSSTRCCSEYSGHGGSWVAVGMVAPAKRALVVG